MAQRYPKKVYKYKRGDDWWWDYLLFSDNDFEEAEFEMSKPEYDALMVLRGVWETSLKPKIDANILMLGKMLSGKD
jgi:hypothetical protein